MVVMRSIVQLLVLIRMVAALQLPVSTAENLTSAEVHPDFEKLLVVDHVPKCGGTFVINLARAAVNSLSPDSLRVVSESSQLTTADVGNNKFVVGVVRNPFDYYISIWGYRAYRDRLPQKDYDAIVPLGSPAGSDPEDPARFAKFIQLFSDKDLGLLSFLFYFSYLDFNEVVSQLNWNYKGTVSDAFVNSGAQSSALEAQIQASLESYSVESGPVDCWVHTESATDDAYACFHKFADLGGLVNFTAFDAEINAEHTNSGNHVGCSELYTPELLDFVRSSDSELFRAFGYSLECSS